MYTICMSSLNTHTHTHTIKCNNTSKFENTSNGNVQQIFIAFYLRFPLFYKKVMFFLSTNILSQYTFTWEAKWPNEVSLWLKKQQTSDNGLNKFIPIDMSFFSSSLKHLISQTLDRQNAQTYLDLKMFYAFI